MVEEDETTLRRAEWTAKGGFTRKVNLFKERLVKDDLLDVLESVYKEILDLLHEVEVGSDNLIAHLKPFKREQVDVDEVNVYLSECDNSCEVLRLLSERRRNVKPGNVANASSAN